MKTILVAIHDKTNEDFGPVYMAKNPAAAVRDFSEACQKNEKWKNYPQDFSICILGEYETDTGKIKPSQEIKILATAEMFVEKEVKDGKKV